MKRHRTTARGVLLLAVMIGLTAGTAAASPSVGAAKVPRLIFPVVGPVTYSDDYGAPRGQGAHQGNDLMAPWRALAVAAENGTVKFHTTSWAAGCMLYLYGDSGTTYYYIHLNNDLTAKNDNRGKCAPGIAYAQGLKQGMRVEAGDVVGYVGDSGDANGIHPHLHFEVRPGGRSATNPYPHLRTAQRLLFSTTRTTMTVSLALTGTVVSADDDLQLKVSTLKASTGLKISKVGRTISLTLTSATVVETLEGRRLPIARLGASLNQPVVVYTAQGGTSLAEKLGAAGALWAERVLLKPTR